MNRKIYNKVNYHAVFRCYNYPEDILYSLKETLTFINNPINEVKVFENTFIKLKEFWERYPTGIIKFG
jgi:hypothetical protein